MLRTPKKTNTKIAHKAASTAVPESLQRTPAHSTCGTQRRVSLLTVPIMMSLLMLLLCGCLGCGILHPPTALEWEASLFPSYNPNPAHQAATKRAAGVAGAIFDEGL